MPYYNTNQETGAILRRSRRRARSQKERVRDFFQDHAGRLLTPDEVHTELFNETCPLTSVRRAITDLTEDGLIEKTPLSRRGTYGKMVHTWRWRRRVK